MYFFVLLAVVGFVASIVVHASTYFTDGLGMDRGAWVLHVGIFVVWLPAVLAQARADAAAKEAAQASGSGTGGGNRFNDLAAYAPRWMWAVVVMCLLYAVVNFATFMFLSREGSPRIEDGRYVLMQRSRVVRPLSKEEFDGRNRYETRYFSGYWLVFYSSAAAMLYSAMRQRQEVVPLYDSPVDPKGS